jgi:hypothetical protein
LTTKKQSKMTMKTYFFWLFYFLFAHAGTGSIETESWLRKLLNGTTA